MANNTLSAKSITDATQSAQFDLLIKNVPVPEIREILKHDDPINELYRLVRNDAALAALFLRVANSASLPVVKNFDDLKRAITKLGTLRSVNLIITYMLRQLLPSSAYDVSTQLIDYSIDTAIALDSIQRKPSSYITGIALFGGAMLVAGYADHMGINVTIGECTALNLELLPVFIRHWSFPEETLQAIDLYLANDHSNIALAISAVAHKHRLSPFPGVDSSLPERQIIEVVSSINANLFF
ncbi:HDOD domain-containing protein [Shewanella xiamenensis]|uniref:HDOD domain-containing protein n=1 Tax=Shewanella xiamenensis TaxID=332186 RepID=UPI002E7C2C2A|nr:HDOD domain-containing protein [Shewanella xiamenensis]MEE1978861.1 HDOD domain-containing protein [Shewanella xiamenensis]